MTKRQSSETNASEHPDNPGTMTETVRQRESEGEGLYQAVFENALNAVSILDDHGLMIDANRATTVLYGLRKEELLGMSFLDFVSHAHKEDAQRLWEEGLKKGELRGEYHITRANGECREVDFAFKANLMPGRHLSILRDITERKQTEARVRDSERRLFQFLEALPVAVFVLDAHGHPYYANETAQHVLGIGVAPEATPDKLGEVYQAYIAGTEQEYPPERMPIVRALAGEKSTIDDMEIRSPDGIIPLQVSASPIYDEQGQLIYAIAAFNDISDRRQYESILQDLAIRDDLTGLYNRRFMGSLLKDEATRCLRYGRLSSLILLDIDHFKAVNDTRGHLVGDEVLRQVAELVCHHVRAVDRVVRYGGEEIAIILPETTDSGAYTVAERIRQAVDAHPFTSIISGKQQPPISTTISAGVATFPGDANSVEALIAAADQALYNAKSEGRNRTVVFSKSPLRTTILKSTSLVEDEQKD
ncbi:MAG: diguanylate cyclase [Chloroflexota bacterium]|nr:diguanylate cyclase [Chloroflexota bacterium]